MGAVTEPRVAVRTPAKILSRVLLPAPFLPMSAMRSLGFIWKEMSLNKVVPPNSTVGASTVIIIVRTGCIFVIGVESYIFLDKNC